MNINEFQKELHNKKEIQDTNSKIIDYLKLISKLLKSKINFYKYNSIFNQYEYKYCIYNNNIFYEKEELENKYILKKDDEILGKIEYSEYIEKEDLEFIERLLLKDLENRKKDIEKDFDILNLKIITNKREEDKFKNFLNKIEKNLNIEYEVLNSIKEEILTKNDICLYFIEDNQLLEIDKEYLLKNNENIIIVGNSDPELSLYCGQFNVIKYFTYDNIRIEELKNKLLNYNTYLYNRNSEENKVITISGISGGIGSTTVSMNTASLLSKNNPDKNVLFIDLSRTKSISNLFLQKDPSPDKTIVDLIESNSTDISSNLNNGLVKIDNNFFMINGIQKHIDGLIFQDEEFIINLLNYINKINEKFNYIVIDLGIVDSSTLSSTLYNVSDELWLITEMNIPNISKLKTFYSLLKRAGLISKLNIIVNRYDSKNSINISDISSILNLDETDDFKIKLPNDYNTLGYCWNYCKLITEETNKSPFLKVLKEILENKKLIKKDKKEKKKEFNLFNIFKR